MKILNLYAGLGGNRAEWGDVDVTAVENDLCISIDYINRFCSDKIITGDAHKYLINHYKEYDFIWSSPPCQSHSSFRHNICVRYRGTEPVYPDMRLWQEILFLKHHCKTKWVVENVKPYYTPLIEPTQIIDRHYFWANFDIPKASFKTEKIRKAQIPQLQKYHNIDLRDSKIKNKRQVLRNCVYSKIGLHIYNCLSKY